ncbi:signal transducer and activator of transcription 1-like [Boleophthalmus pectinirostris]|uniref:signal transducer and activator of transcription 1-like n=1 Tax=Boleophthalmus pectinirostris TaxID=150288 RepID=UPI00242E3654|nr:signal transducer and activator of transcription 1-like [Boleophthalmus pectinirostris]
MAQWQELLKLDPLMQSRVCQLYEGKFPREIRHCLCNWIESQNWELIASDEPTAWETLQALGLKLDELKNESVRNSNVLMGPDYSAMKDVMMKNFEARPKALAEILSECLREEKAILTSCLKDQNCSTEEQNHKDLDNKVKELNKQTWETEKEIRSLEALNEKLGYIQTTWESQLENVNGLPHEVVQQECLKQANFIVQTQQVVVDQIVKSVNLAAQIVQRLVSVEIPEWKYKQQMSCIGNPVCTSLEHLEKWFSGVAESLLQIIQQLKKLEEQSRPQINPKCDLSQVIQQISSFTKNLLIKLMENALVVEKQPVMSRTHRPCILKTKIRFTVALRFLVNLPMFKTLLKVKPVFDKDVEEVRTIKGYRQFVFMENQSKWLDVYTPNGGLVAEFEHLSIKEEGSKSRSKGSNESSIGVTEELHIIKFVTKLQMPELECNIEASSLPVVVVSSTNQIPSAWASVMWYNLLSVTQPTTLSLFLDPPPLSWEQLSQALSWQFISAGDRELNQDQLNELKLKIVDDPDDLVYWHKFAKNEGPWIWIDGILDLIQKHLRDIWRDGCIMGFVNKVKTHQLLQNKQSGNFLLRFSESNREGAITFSWVEHSNREVNVHAVDPYTKKELSAMSLPDIIYHYSLRAQQSSNPLVYLYPDIPKDNVFGQYYTTQENSAPINKDGYINRKLVVVSDRPTPPPSPPSEAQMDVDTDGVKGPWSVSSEEWQEFFPDALDPTIAPNLPPFEQMFPFLTSFDSTSGL